MKILPKSVPKSPHSSSLVQTEKMEKKREEEDDEERERTKTRKKKKEGSFMGKIGPLSWITGQFLP